jgi:hypothetical protein
MRGLDDVRSWLAQPNTGTVETLAAPWWRLITKYRPDIRVVVVRRPVQEVVDSLMAMGHFADRALVAAHMRKLDAKLCQIEKRVPNAASVSFKDLTKQSVCQGLFEYCTGTKDAPGRWAAFDQANIQCSMPAMIRYAAANCKQLTKFAGVAKQASLYEFVRKPVIPPDGVIFAQEPFAQWSSEVREKLINFHAAQINEAPDMPASMDWDLMGKLADVGNFQVVTARLNGRMFGYLTTIISPSMEIAGTSMAIHTKFFAVTQFPGLGLKLQRYAMQTLIDRGVEDIWWRAGSRGDGPRMAPLYRRLGGVPDGELFRLNLRGL